MIYIFDLDSTVANIDHRLHFIQKKDGKPTEEDYRKFYAACKDDRPIDEVIRVARALFDAGYTILLLSGRSDEVRGDTQEWLLEYLPEYHTLYMREADDHREDVEIKQEMLEQVKKDFPGEKIMGVFEDRSSVVDMWRGLGLRAFQVAEGDF